MSDLHLPAIKPKEETTTIINFIKSTFTDAGKTEAIIALSGGVDSATSCALAARALGPEHIHALLLPSFQTSETHTKDAMQAAEACGITHDHILEINLAAIQQAFATTLQLYTSPSKDSLLKVASHPITFDRLGNIAARIRMTLIYDQARAHDALVIGTENRSEHLLGYYTRYGDEASDLEPILHLYKTQVFAIAAHLKVPQHIVKKAPTADLWADQTDEAELGFSYLDADPILYHHFDQHKSQEQLADMGYNPQLILKILTHCQRIDFKHHVPYHL